MTTTTLLLLLEDVEASLVTPSTPIGPLPTVQRLGHPCTASHPTLGQFFSCILGAGGARVAVIGQSGRYGVAHLLLDGADQQFWKVVLHRHPGTAIEHAAELRSPGHGDHRVHGREMSCVGVAADVYLRGA